MKFYVLILIYIIVPFLCAKIIYKFKVVSKTTVELFIPSHYKNKIRSYSERAVIAFAPAGKQSHI